MVQINCALCNRKERAQFFIHNLRGQQDLVVPSTLRSIRMTVKLSIQPTEYAGLGSAECFDPAVEQKLFSPSRAGNLLSFGDHRTATAEIEMIALQHRLV